MCGQGRENPCPPEGGASGCLQSGHSVLGLGHQVDAALQILHPVDELAHGGTRHGQPMLGHDHSDVELAHHARPQAQDLAGHHVTPVEGFHRRDVGLERGDHAALDLRGGKGRPQIPREQDLADRVIELEVALGVQKVGGQGDQGAVADGDVHALIRDAVHPVGGLAGFAKVRRKTLPHLGDVERRGGRGHPAVQRGNDVRVGMGGHDGRQPLGREVARDPQVQLVVGHVATRIDDGARVLVDDEELVGGDRLTDIAGEVGEHQALVVCVFVEFLGHGCGAAQGASRIKKDQRRQRSQMSAC